MARPLEFERDAAIDSAIRVFARHGYEGASTSDLIAGMGIGRQSLYGAFGDKRGLFLQALRRYADRSLAEMQAALDGRQPATGTAIAALEAAVLVGLGSSDDLETGCLGVGSVAEFGRSDPDINAINDAAGLTLHDAFAARIRAGIAAGELDPELDASGAARMLLVLRSGLKIAARGGAGAQELAQTARLAMRGMSRD